MTDALSRGKEADAAAALSTEKILVVLRDGRHLVGYIRSFDQYCASLARCLCVLHSVLVVLAPTTAATRAS